MKSHHPHLIPPCTALRILAVAVCAAGPASAFDFQIGDVDARLDLTVSVGGMYRVKSAQPDLIGLAAGGAQFSVNADDGNLNYSKGWVSAPVLATADLDLRYQRSGAFFRASAFYDYINEERDRERTPLSPEALDRVGSRFDMLDAYVWHNFRVGGAPVNLRLGRQVINWGESTFIPNGINVVNPVDVSMLRQPGSELRNAFLPVWLASVSAGITDNVTVEAFYQFRWKEIIIDPPGTYFSTNDFVGRGGDRVFLGFGSLPDDGDLGAIPRGEDRRPTHAGQFGLAARIYAPELNGTEFGLYFVHYHSRVPVLSARTPTSAIDPAVVQATAGNLAQANLAPAMIAQGIAPETVSAVLPQLVGAALMEVPVEGLPPELASFAPFYPGALQIASGARQVGFLTAAATGRYLVEYPESIKLLGASFNTDVGTTGISLQGELSYRWDQPLQIDDVELLFAALSSINPGFAAVNQLGDFSGQLDTYVRGWSRESVWQAQMTATKVFGPMLGSNQAVFLVEAGANYVPGLPGKDELRFEAPGTFLGGSEIATQAGLQPATEPRDHFADRFSWGYRAVGRLDYDNLLFSTNVSPMIQFAHDVAGTTPQPIGNFVEHRKSVTLGAQATYQLSWTADINYTKFFGAGRRNLIRDRDFVTATVKYSF